MADTDPSVQDGQQIVDKLALLRRLLPTYISLIVAALLPIYAGSHASLSRPSSAAKTKTKKRREHGSQESSGQRMEGLSPSDAILYPVMTGCLLMFLYVLIQWLKDPEILNTIINWYLSIFGVFSVAKLVGDSMSVLESFLFPKRFTDVGLIWNVNPKTETAIATTTQANSATNTAHRISPLPGVFSRLPLPLIVYRALWKIRHVVTQNLLLVEAFAQGIFEADVHIGLNGIIGLLTSIASLLFFNLVSKPWWLTNIFGFSFSYSALQLISPTTFWTGTLVLTSLFFYDIYFVFFTPVMVTVATKLDVPVKLLIPKPADEDPAKLSLAMLGLGDIVLPGMMIGLALRFDLYIFYLRKQKRKAQSVANEEGNPYSKPGSVANGSDPSHVEDSQVSLVYDKTGIGKAEYVNATRGWGERFWLGKSKTTTLEGGLFPKTYFYASVVGYVLGMVCTVCIMHFANHAQPALLYLVPSVLISLWGTAAFRGEIQMMWTYTEDEEAKKKEQEKKLGVKSSNQEGEDIAEGGATPTGNKTVNSGEAKAHGEQDEGGDDTKMQKVKNSRNTGPPSGEKQPSESPKDQDGKKKKHTSKTNERVDRSGKIFYLAISISKDVESNDKETNLDANFVEGLKTISKGPLGQDPSKE